MISAVILYDRNPNASCRRGIYTESRTPPQLSGKLKMLGLNVSGMKCFGPLSSIKRGRLEAVSPLDSFRSSHVLLAECHGSI
jgi:hypothetical protein